MYYFSCGTGMTHWLQPTWCPLIFALVLVLQTAFQEAASSVLAERVLGQQFQPNNSDTRQINKIS